MNKILPILIFGAPYLRRYWFRFCLGSLCGLLFGMTNAATVGGVNLLFSRLKAPAAPMASTALAAPVAAAPVALAKVSPPPTAKKAQSHHTRFLSALVAAIQAKLDSFLPLAGRKLDWKQVVGGLLFFPLLAAIRGAFNYGSTYFMTWSGQRIVNDIKLALFNKINEQSLDFFHKHSTGELLSWINNDTGALQACIRLGFSDLIKEPATILSTFGALLYLDWKLTLVSLIFLPLCLIPARIIQKKIRRQSQSDNNYMILQANVTMESFQNIRVTKAFELGEEHARQFDQAIRSESRSALKIIQARATLNPTLETLNAFGIGAVFLYAAWAGVSVVLLSTFIAALFAFYTPFKKLGTISIYFTTAGFAVDRLIAAMRMEPSVKDPVAPRLLPQFSSELALKNVNFSYGDGPVLQGINITIAQGQRIGLVGESGSGKSTLTNLIMRFYDPTRGSIEIDGVPVDQVRLADLHSQMALVSQEVLLFNATVAENIALGKVGATRGEITQAAKEAHAHGFISNLPQGYDTPIGERGVRLSGGQRQRLAIARAFVRNAPILILDEATASLDSQSEAEVQSAIDHLAENRTVICVAHRLSTLRSMDHIYVLKEGQIVEEGGFDELLDRNGLFASMAARQSIFSQTV